MSEPCGAWMVTEVVEGMPYALRWCNRTDGPCPFPGATPSRDHHRRCGALPGKQLIVTYGEDRLVSALDVLRAMLTAQIDGSPQWIAVCVAVDALRACLGDDR